MERMPLSGNVTVLETDDQAFWQFRHDHVEPGYCHQHVGGADCCHLDNECAVPETECVQAEHEDMLCRLTPPAVTRTS